jgi:hypothetical protein
MPHRIVMELANGTDETRESRPERTAKRWPLWLRLVLWATVGYVAVILMLMFLENSLIFIPSRYPLGDWDPPLPVEDAWFEAADGTRLHGWYLAHPDPVATVLFCHGNAGNVAGRAGVMATLKETVGVSVLVFDYRGYGRSEGSPSETGVLADVRAARRWLAEREQTAPQNVVLMGRSLGGAVAVDVAADEGARALVLESTFTSVPDMAGHIYPWLPARWLVRTRFNSLKKIPHYHGPLLQSHSEDDTIVPLELGKRLFDAANEPKQFIRFTGQDHNEMPPMTYYWELREFLKGLPEPAGQESP